MTDPVLHLVRRATWGPTPTLLDEVARRGAARWLEDQLAPASLADPACDALLRRFPKLGRTPQQVLEQDPNANYGTMQQLGYATVGRYTWSNRQLFEVLCDFWSNHLNVPCPITAVWADRHDYDAAVIRKHALGSFSAMLLASSRHPSMLRYLDGATSSAASPNQNYGRELLELHTLGVDGGYDETTVQDVARVMTGWTLTRQGTAQFSAKRYGGGAAGVLDWSTPAHDPSRGPDVQASLLAYLAAHPSTATHLATKLCLRFVSDTPPPALVARLARTYLDSDTRVVPVLRALFSSEEFAQSAGAKTRRPLEGLVAAVRTLGAAPGTTGFGGADVLFLQARDLGHAPLSWPAPNGYPDVATAWVSAGSTMRRWNHTWELATRRKPEALTWPATDPLLKSLPASWGELVPALVQRLVHRPATERETAALLRFCDRSPATVVSASDPWFGSRGRDLVAVVLDVPGHMER